MTGLGLILGGSSDPVEPLFRKGHGSYFNKSSVIGPTYHARFASL